MKFRIDPTVDLKDIARYRWLSVPDRINLVLHTSSVGKLVLGEGYLRDRSTTQEAFYSL